MREKAQRHKGGGETPVREMLGVVCEVFGVDEASVLGPGMRRELLDARHAWWLLARRRTALSYPELATVAKRAAHSTVVKAVGRARDRYERGWSAATPVGSADHAWRVRVDRCDGLFLYRERKRAEAGRVDRRARVRAMSDQGSGIRDEPSGISHQRSAMSDRRPEPVELGSRRDGAQRWGGSA